MKKMINSILVGFVVTIFLFIFDLIRVMFQSGEVGTHSVFFGAGSFNVKKVQDGTELLVAMNNYVPLLVSTFIITIVILLYFKIMNYIKQSN